MRPEAGAPNAERVAYVLNHAQEALYVRIAQLEAALEDAGVKVPEAEFGWELA
jgi:hypothetical protein